jgi:hypothetical protein
MSRVIFSFAVLHPYSRVNITTRIMLSICGFNRVSINVVLKAYTNSRIFVRLMRKSESTKSAKRSIHNSTAEVYHQTSGERDMQIFKNKLVDDVFWRLTNYGPAFSIVPDDITFLKEPCDYYQELLVCVFFTSSFTSLTLFSLISHLIASFPSL